MREKRQHKRVKIKAIGELQGKNDPIRFKVAVGDISFGGVELFSEKNLEKGDRFDLTLTFLPKKGKSLVGVFPGAVCWAVPYKKGTIGGFQFDQVITKEGRPEFLSFILDKKRVFGSP